MEFKEYAIEAIKAKQGQNVIGAVTHVSKSGMSSRVRCWVLSEDDKWQEITMLMKGAKNNQGVLMSGYGTDMALLALYVFYQTFIDSQTALRWANNYQSITY